MCESCAGTVKVVAHKLPESGKLEKPPDAASNEKALANWKDSIRAFESGDWGGQQLTVSHTPLVTT